MPTHTTPPPHADQTDQTAEPARRASRFDERGIALQTVIIMVVLLAIAGGVAAVLLSRGREASSQLEEQSVTTPVSGYDGSESLCEAAGYEFHDDNSCNYKTDAQCERAYGDGYEAEAADNDKGDHERGCDEP